MIRLIALVIFITHANVAFGERRYRYIDSGGTIHWVDSIKEVPKQYLNQFKKIPAWYYYGSGPGKRINEYLKPFPMKRQQLSRGGMRRVWRPKGASSWSGL
jgi:hypothetical protein